MRKPRIDERWERTDGGLIVPRRPTLPTRRFIQKWGTAKCCCEVELTGACTDSPCGSPLYLTGSGFASNGSCTGCTFCTSVLNQPQALSTPNYINYSTGAQTFGCGDGNPYGSTSTSMCLKKNDAETAWWWEAVVTEGLAGDPSNTQTGVFRSATMSESPAWEDCAAMEVQLSLYDTIVAGTGGCCDFSGASLLLTSTI